MVVLHGHDDLANMSSWRHIPQGLRQARHWEEAVWERVQGMRVDVLAQLVEHGLEQGWLVNKHWAQVNGEKGDVFPEGPQSHLTILIDVTFAEFQKPSIRR